MDHPKPKQSKVIYEDIFKGHKFKSNHKSSSIRNFLWTNAIHSINKEIANKLHVASMRQFYHQGSAHIKNTRIYHPLFIRL